jgi:pyruvate dehydrogenase E1 component
MMMVPDQISRWVPRTYLALGTDGFGRSDSRKALREFFEIDKGHIVVAVLSGLASDGVVKPNLVKEALDRYGIDPERPDPAHTH